jgi:hypothetical protein
MLEFIRFGNGDHGNMVEVRVATMFGFVEFVLFLEQ